MSDQQTETEFSLLPVPEPPDELDIETEQWPSLTRLIFTVTAGSYAVGHAVQYPELSLSVVGGRAFVAGAVVTGVYKAGKFFKGN